MWTLTSLIPTDWTEEHENSHDLYSMCYVSSNDGRRIINDLRKLWKEVDVA
jgi:hypothetical protein